MYKRIDPHENVYVMKSFRNGSKTSSRIFKKLGKLPEIMQAHDFSRQEALDWIDAQVKLSEKEEDSDSSSVTVTFDKNKRIDPGVLSFVRVGQFFITRVLASVGLPAVCKKIQENRQFQYNLASITSFLVINRILDPDSKRAAFIKMEEFPEDYDFSLEDIYRALDVLAENSMEIQSFLFKASGEIIDRSVGTLIYDCSNFYTETEEPSGIRQYSRSKDHKPNPVIGMGLFTDSDGIPLRMSVFEGNKAESTTIDKAVINSLRKDFDIKQFIYSADAALGYEGIKQSLEHFHFPCHYVVTQSLKKMDEANQKWALGKDVPEEENWWFYQKMDPETGELVTYKILFKDIDKEKQFETVFFKDKWVKNKTTGREERYVVTYSVKYEQYLRSLRENHVERALKKLQKQGKRKQQTDPARLIEETHYTKEGEKAKKTEYSLNREKVEYEEQFDGFYCVATDLEEDRKNKLNTISDILAINRNRWRIEQAFRDMKSLMDARPVYVRRDERIEGHFLICFIALLVVCLLEKMLKNRYTTENLLETLRDMKLARLPDGGYMPIFKRTELSDELEELFNLPLSMQYITSAKFKALLERSQRKMKNFKKIVQNS